MLLPERRPQISHASCTPPSGGSARPVHARKTCSSDSLIGRPNTERKNANHVAQVTGSRNQRRNSSGCSMAVMIVGSVTPPDQKKAPQQGCEQGPRWV